jgi:hypothetical protein
LLYLQELTAQVTTLHAAVDANNQFVNELRGQLLPLAQASAGHCCACCTV